MHWLTLCQRLHVCIASTVHDQTLPAQGEEAAGASNVSSVRRRNFMGGYVKGHD